MLKVDVENLYSELNEVKEKLNNKLTELKIKGISNENLLIIKDIFKKTLETENFNYIESKKNNNLTFKNILY
jgi:hypothetical protein